MQVIYNKSFSFSFPESFISLKYNTSDNHSEQNTIYYSWPPAEEPSPENQLVVEKEQSVESTRLNALSLVRNEQKP